MWLGRYRNWPIYLVVGALALVGGASHAQTELTDPYVVLGKYLDRLGGLDRLRAETSTYTRGEFSASGMTGPIEVWTQTPDLQRVDVTIGPLVVKQGSNGEYEWVLDQNDKLQIVSKDDEATKKRRNLAEHMSRYAFVDPNSDVFTVRLLDGEDVDGKPCYVVRIDNSINDDSQTMFIGAEDFLLHKIINISGEKSNDSYSSDYREVDGIWVAHHVRQIDHLTRQEQTVIVQEHVSNPELPKGIFDPPGQGVKDYTFAEGDRSENIPFLFTGGHIVIQTVVGCRERPWVLDSGAGMTVISRTFADELGLEVTGDLKGSGAGGTVDVKFTDIESLSVQGATLDAQTIAVIDMSELSKVFGIEIAGILGYDFLSRFVTKVDYAAELVSFYDPESFQYAGEGSEIDVHLKNSIFEVEATLDGEHAGTWLFDLGASGVSLSGNAPDSLGYAEREGLESVARGAQNAFTSKSIKCDRLDMAGFEVVEPRVSFKFPKPAVETPRDRLGALGNTFFRNFVLYLDYANERVIVEKGARFNKPWPVDHSGMQLANEDGGHVGVRFVSPDTPADKAGFKEGDVVKSINGIEAHLFNDLLAIREVLMGPPGKKVDVIVAREGRDKRLKLKLEELL